MDEKNPHCEQSQNIQHVPHTLQTFHKRESERKYCDAQVARSYNAIVNGQQPKNGFSFYHSCSYDIDSLHKEVPPSLLPDYLVGAQNERMYKCIEKAKLLDKHFKCNIDNAR